jgi:uncharacterized membrane protein YphA (DoxX/SURF4 family)
MPMKELGLIAFAAIFVWGAWQQISAPKMFAELSRKAGIPAIPLLVVANGVVMLVAIVGLQLPVTRRLAALVLVPQVVIATWISHRFWTFEPGFMRITNRNHFMKNVSLVGALIYLAGEE